MSVRTESAPRPQEPEPNKESIAWLVALGSSPPQWWTGRGDEWTSEVDGAQRNPAHTAIRFARREDADRAIGWLLNPTLARGCKAEEHLWLARRSPEEAPPVRGEDGT